jgi:RNase P subunit RPR2
VAQSRLSFVQKLARTFCSPSMFEKLKADSNQWGFTCGRCRKPSSIWDIGGIRYKAKGNPRTRVKCPHCGEFGFQRIERSA